MRISLRTFLTFLTVFAIFFGWRCNQRRTISAAVARLERANVALSYRWQKPTVGAASEMVIPAYSRDITYSVQMPDGTFETRTRNVGYTVWAPAAIQDVTLNETVRPEVHVTGFVFGTHDDVAVDVVALEPKSIDDAMINELRELDGLKTVLLKIDRQYYRVLVAGWAPPEWRDEELAELTKPIEEATSLLESKLANVVVARGIVSR